MTSRVTLLLSLALLGFAVADTIYLNGVFHDQAPDTMWQCGGSPGTANDGNGWSDTDFQISGYQSPEFGLAGAECNAVNGWAPPACGQLGSDQTPVYAYTGQSPGKNIGSPSSFHNFFHASSESVEVPFSLPLTLDSATGSYTYINDSFFPLDGLGWTDKCMNAHNQLHNFAFCFVAHSLFGYTGSEVFNFAGDDDVYVYINKLLVIDLGSLHTKLSKSLVLSENPTLVPGNTYTMDFFYCERHTTESDIEMATSLQFYCSYTDWCGVCQGTGQSCCTQSVLNTYCNDNTVCTVDTCGTTASPITDPNNGGCVHTPITCPAAADECHISSCDPVNGCQMTPVVCNDGNPCTTDACNPSVGCQFTPVVCNDNNVCTTDACGSTGNCVYTNTTLTACNDNNACTNDGCDPISGCTNVAITCNDNDKCTSDSCDKSSGCKFTDISASCNDNNLCTADSCSASSGCANAIIPCNAPDKCSTAACTPAAGCQLTPVDCNDNNPCTDDSCSGSTGCVNTPKNCDDGDACTADACNAIGNCTHTVTQANCGVCGAVTCTFTDPCNPSICDQATTTCGVVPIVCNDSNACTTDSCAANGKLAQCNYVPITCTAPDTCNLAYCDKVKGCGTTPVVCNDNNNCTIDSCNPTPGNATCVYADVVCNTTDLCNPASCDPLTGTCINTAVNCDDHNACTADQCVTEGGVATCTHTPKVCGTACDPAYCNTTTGACVSTPRTCDDSNPCTSDEVTCLVNATSGVGAPSCNYTLIPSPCDDMDNCTIDMCNATGTEAKHCIHTNITCTPNLCQTYANVCDPINGCVFNNVTCAGTGDYCLQGHCDLAAGCVQLRRVCPLADPGCYVVACNSSLSKCVQTERSDFKTATSTAAATKGTLCPLVYTPAVKKAAISSGVIAGAVIGGAVGLAALGAGGKAGYDYLAARSGGMGAVQANPLYEQGGATGTSALYGG